ncbi:hypothetical protein MBLNU230_g7542t1 [Neophaeotheca triangularis]
MAADAQAAEATNGTPIGIKPIERSITLASDPGTRIHLRLTILAATVTLFLTSAALDAGQAGSSMGSLVYAMPDRYNPNQPISTALYTVPSSLDFATRMAKLLARKTKKPCYVSSSINLSGSVQGGTVEEEMEAFRTIVQVVMNEAETSSQE